MFVTALGTISNKTIGPYNMLQKGEFYEHFGYTERLITLLVSWKNLILGFTCTVGPVAYLGGGARCDGPPWPDHENFLQATLYKKVRFCYFLATIAKFNNV